MWTSIRTFLKHKDIEYVRQGILFFEAYISDLDSFLDGSNNILSSFDKNIEVTTLFSLEYLQQLFSTFPHKNYIALWCLGQLAQFDEFEFAVQNLQTLDLSKMKLTRLPANIENLKYLEILDLWKNRLHSCDEICELTKLRWLDLRENKLASLPELNKLSQLEWLDLEDNVLGTVSQQIKNLPKLRYLNIDGSNALANVRQ